MAKNFRYLDIITVFFVTILLVSNIVSTKITDIGPFIFDAGTLLFPLSYIFGDILTEVYWYKKNQRIIWLWFWAAALMSAIIIIVWILPADSQRNLQKEYMSILGLAPRIVFASLIAYIVWSFSNSYILAKLKIITKWKHLRTRTIWSTLVWEILDSAIFVTIAFYGIYENNLLLSILISNYIFKIWVEILFTPLTYLTTNFLKKTEHEDFYDYQTNFNPLK